VLLADTEDEITRVRAERMGVDPGADLRPRVLTVCFASMSVATRGWVEDGAPGDLPARLNEVVGLLGAGFEPRA
jgi:class 3 adenylate cyclase